MNYLNKINKNGGGVSLVLILHSTQNRYETHITLCYSYVNMNDLIIESNLPKDWGNSLHLLTEATDKMARPRYTIDGVDGKYRSPDDNDSSKQQQPRKLTTATSNDKSNYNNNKRTMTSNSDSDDDMLPSPNDNRSNSKGSLKKRK